MIQYQDIPFGYTHCFYGREKCPKAETCLHAVVARLREEHPDEQQPQNLSVVNPFFLKQQADLSACPFYRSSEPERCARGMTHLFDNIPLKQAPALRRRVIGCFSCERYFYHCRRGERLITPQEQQLIANVFRSAGIEESPQYDKYEYAVLW